MMAGFNPYMKDGYKLPQERGKANLMKPHREEGTMKYPNRYVITALVKEGDKKGERVWLYWSVEGGGWWQWSRQEDWAKRFVSKSGDKFEDAVICAPKVGPWYYTPEPDTIEVREVPAIVEVR